MKIKELTEFAERTNGRLAKNNLQGYDTEKKILHATVKANEEMGELCDAVLSHLGSQRKIKMEVHAPENLANEVADVMFTLALLAQLTGVDLEKALKEKMTIIDRRYEGSGKERN